MNRGPVNRRDLLNQTAGLVAGSRNQQYGEPTDNFTDIAGYWNAHLDSRPNPEAPLDATDVAIMMAGAKLARLGHNRTHKDSWIDAAGYAICGADIALNDAADKDAAAARTVDELPEAMR